MNIRKITFFIALCLLPGLSTAALMSQSHQLTGNSYYSFTETDGNGDIITNTTTLTGSLLVTIDDVNFTAEIDYSNVLLDGISFRPIDTLTTDLSGISSAALISGWNGEPDYASYGNATLSSLSPICLECSYEMILNLAANPLILSYHEFNPYDTGAVDFEIYVSQVPLPAAAWLFGSGLIGLVGLARRRKLG